MQEFSELGDEVLDPHCISPRCVLLPITAFIRFKKIKGAAVNDCGHSKFACIYTETISYFDTINTKTIAIMAMVVPPPPPPPPHPGVGGGGGGICPPSPPRPCVPQLINISIALYRLTIDWIEYLLCHCMNGTKKRSALNAWGLRVISRPSVVYRSLSGICRSITMACL